MQISKTFKTILTSIRSKEKPLVEKELCSIPITVVDGSIRSTADQDDAWWFYLAKHHHVIFDIGCNVGYTALLALIQDPHKKMVLVDPNPQALCIASKNIIMNNFGNRVNYVSAFIGDTIDETVKFYTVGAGAAGSMYASHAQTASSINASMDVKTLTLDYLFEYFNLAPDLIKIDVEGAETLVMTASKKLAKATQCDFFIEMHNVEGLGMEGAAQKMLDWCQEMNYKAWYLKTASELLEAKTVKERGKCHLLLMPKDKLYPDYLRGVSQYASLPEKI